MNIEMQQHTGVELIELECQRHVEVEGWTPEHDDAHDNFELRAAGVCYHSYGQNIRVPRLWPWHSSWWKPTPGDPIRALVKAGALFTAEAKRLERRRFKKPSPGEFLIDSLAPSYYREQSQIMLDRVARIALEIDELLAVQSNSICHEG